MGANASQLIDSFPIDLLLHTFSFATYQELCAYSQINRLCFASITANDMLWRSVCLKVWSEKKYVPSLYKRLAGIESVDASDRNVTDDTKTEMESKSNECDARKALRLSVLDCERTVISMRELCDDTQWFFHFKGNRLADAEHWTRMHFGCDGSVTFHSDRRNDITAGFFAGKRFVWEFTGALSQSEKFGNAIRINNFVPEKVSRSKDWGWVIQNPHVIYASFAMSAPNSDEFRELLIDYNDHERRIKEPFGKARYIKREQTETEKETIGLLSMVKGFLD